MSRHLPPIPPDELKEGFAWREYFRKIDKAIERAMNEAQTEAIAGSGTVTSLSVVTANGISGTVATATTTPAITLAIVDSGLSLAKTSGLQDALDAKASLTSLAASSGSSLVGYLPAGTGAVATTVQGKLRESVSVKDFGAVGDGVTDDTAAIQAAIDHANTFVSTLQQRSYTTVILPDGVYSITAQLIVKANVNFLCNGYLFNNLASTTAFCIQFKAGSACERLVIWGNAKGGALFGDAGSNNDLQIGDVRMLNMGEATNQFACRFVGYNFTVESIDIDGGNVGLDIGDGAGVGASDIRIDKCLLYSASTGFRISSGSEHIHIGYLDIDSVNWLGIQLDSCHDVNISDFICFFNDAEVGSCFDRGYAIEIGTFSGTPNEVTGLNISGRVINTGKTDNVLGTALKLSNIKDSYISLAANNSTILTGNAHRIVQAVEYGTGVAASVLVEGNFASTLTATSGTVAGGLRYWNGAGFTSTGAISATGVISGSNLSGINTGDQTNIAGNAATVTTNANLTGVVTSVGNATAIADAALSIAKTSGLQIALDAKAPSASPVFTGTVRLPGYTVAGLPAGTVGDMAYVTDATAPTYLGTLTGGGVVHCPVFRNATGWVAA